MSNSQVKTERKTYLDLLRIIAIVLVLFMHVDGYDLYLTSKNLRWIHIFMMLVPKISVPLFLMISGALLLRKTESIKYTLKHRVLRMAIVLVVFSALVFYARRGYFNLYDFLWIFYRETLKKATGISTSILLFCSFCLSITGLRWE